MNTGSGLTPSDPGALDPAGADRLLDGLMTVDEAPAGYEDVVRLVDVIRTGVASEELIWEPRTIGQMVGAIRGSQRRSNRPRLRLATAAAVTTVVAVVSTGTAAATGALPGSLQVVAHGIAAHLGLSVPRSSQPQSSSPKLSWVIEPARTMAVGSARGRASQHPVASTSAADRPAKPGTDIRLSPTATAPISVVALRPGSVAPSTVADSKPSETKAAGPTATTVPAGKARTTDRGKSTKSRDVQSPHCPDQSCHTAK